MRPSSLRRGPHIASHSVCLSVCLSVRLSVRPSRYYTALLPRRGPHIASHFVCPSVCPSVPLSLPSVTSFRQPLASRMYFSARTEGIRTFWHALRAAYRTAISAAQILVVFVYFFYSRTVLRANIQNRKTSVFAYRPASRMYFSARTEGRISYSHLGRTNFFFTI